MHTAIGLTRMELPNRFHIRIIPDFIVFGDECCAHAECGGDNDSIGRVIMKRSRQVNRLESDGIVEWDKVDKWQGFRFDYPVSGICCELQSILGDQQGDFPCADT